MAMKIETDTVSRRVSAKDLQPGTIVHGVVYDTTGTHPLSKAGYYLVTHTRALVSLPEGFLTTGIDTPVVVACCEEYEGTLTVRRK